MAKENFLYKKVYSDLKGKIISRQFPPNAKLPKEKELCETYQVSMITVKKALELLAEEKRIVRVPGKGPLSQKNQLARENRRMLGGG